MTHPLHGQISACRKINSGFPQCSVLGPLLFLVYINDLPDDITSTYKIFVDDTRKGSDIDKPAEAVAQRCSVKKMFLESSQNSQQKNLCQSLFFNKVAS